MTQVRFMTQLPNTELRSYHSSTKGLHASEGQKCIKREVSGVDINILQFGTPYVILTSALNYEKVLPPCTPP